MNYHVSAAKYMTTLTHLITREVKRKMSVEKIEEQIRAIYKLIDITKNDKTIRMYCRMLVYRMECKKATVRAAALQAI
jgi:phosphotransacetylase